MKDNATATKWAAVSRLVAARNRLAAGDHNAQRDIDAVVYKMARMADVPGPVALEVRQ